MSINVGANLGSATQDRSELDVLLDFVDWVESDFPDLTVSADSLTISTVVGKELHVVDSKPPLAKQRVKRVTSDTERLHKAREKERRRYYRNKNRLSGLRRTAASLERQLSSLTRVKQPSSPASPASFLVDHGNADGHCSDAFAGAAVASASRQEDLQLRYADLLRMKTRLHDENEQLRCHLSEASQRVRLLSKRVFTEQVLYLASAAGFRLLDPLSVETCALINRDHSELIDGLKRELWPAPSALDKPSGWSERREVDDSRFKFAVGTRYSNSSAADVCNKVWALLLHPLSSRKLFSEGSSVRMRLVQKIDGDNFVVLKEMESGTDDRSLIRSLLLISRVATANGVRINVNTLDKDQAVVEDFLADPSSLDTLHNHEVWATREQLMWVECEQRDDSCVVTVGGVMPIGGASTRFWMAEAVLVCLRAEMAIGGSRFSLHS